jgi:cell division protein FtsL
VKAEEPPQQYWNSLLPRIHQRIEAQEAKKFSWDKVSAVWKVLVPIAAIILIALIYYLVKPSNTQITRDEKKNEKIIKDSSKENNTEEKKIPENKQDERIVKEEKHQPENYVKKNRKTNRVNDDNLAKEEIKIKDDNIQNNIQQEPLKEDLAADMEETSVFSMGEGAGLDEETENELKNLNNNEQDALLEELESSNL